MTTPMPRLWIALLTLLLLTPAVRADERVVREFGSGDLSPGFASSRRVDAVPPDGVWRSGFGPFAVVEAVSPPANGPRTVTVLTLDNPGIARTRYALLGDVAYENVDGRACLEMWSDFPGGGHFFSRTLGDNGPMMAITGTSAKRPFMLPFNSNPGTVPNKLTLNVVMPGKGKVTLSDIRLVENAEPTSGPAARPVAAGPTEPAPPSLAGLPPEAARQLREQLSQELVAYLKARQTADETVMNYRRMLGANSPDAKRAELSLADIDRRIAGLKNALTEPATPTTPAAVTAMMTPVDVKHAGNGVSAFTFTQPDPSGTRQMIVQHYPRPAGGFPATLRGRFTWHDVTGEAASIGHFSDQRMDHERVASGRVRTNGRDGSIDFDLPMVDADAEWVAVNVACPGPGRYEVELPDSLSAVSTSFAWLGRHSAYLFAGLVAAMLLAMVPLRLLMKSGRGRAVVVGFFGLMFVGGVGQLFAAGVALGMGRPADAWVTLLGGAAVLIVCGGMMLRQAKAHYAVFELRKLRAMDVA